MICRTACFFWEERSVFIHDFPTYNISDQRDGVGNVCRLLGLMLFCIGIGMVIGMLIAESVIVLIAAAISLLCGYQLFCR